jgi:hypothetical protein
MAKLTKTKKASVKKVIKGLNKASKLHASQAKKLKKVISPTKKRASTKRRK